MKEILEWDAVLADGTRIPITVEEDGAAGMYLWHVDGDQSFSTVETSAHAAHQATDNLLHDGHDVRDLVPRGKPSRAELEAIIRDLQARLNDSEITSDARRGVLLDKAVELRQEWIRAERAESELRRLCTLAQALIDALPKCDLAGRDSAKHGPAMCDHLCDACMATMDRCRPDEPYASPLRALLATLNPTPKDAT